MWYSAGSLEGSSNHHSQSGETRADDEVVVAFVCPPWNRFTAGRSVSAIDGQNFADQSALEKRRRTRQWSRLHH